jgi:hypothetical protein
MRKHGSVRALKEMFNKKKRISQLIQNFGLEALREETTWGDLDIE